MGFNRFTRSVCSHANLLVGVSSVNHSGARQVVAPPGGDGEPVAAHQRSCDQLDDLKVLLQVLDDALFGGKWEKGFSVLVFIMTIIVCLFVFFKLRPLCSPCPAFDRSA